MLGIGANTAIFSLVKTVLLQQLPYDRPGDLVWVWSIRPDNRGPFNVPDFIDYRDRNRTLESIAAVAETNANLTGEGEPVRFTGDAGLREPVSPAEHGRGSRPNARTRRRPPRRARGSCSYARDMAESVWG